MFYFMVEWENDIMLKCNNNENWDKYMLKQFEAYNSKLTSDIRKQSLTPYKIMV